MHSSTQETLSGTFLQVVEKLTFMFGEIAPKEDLPVAGRIFSEARMSFHGDLAGTLSVAVTGDLKPEIAANILGLDAEDPECRLMMNDALAEMLNVVCGHVIMDIAGAGANFKLNSPEIRELDGEDLQAMIAEDHYLGFMLEDTPAFLGFELEN